jgi:hypothetical protein
MLWSGVIVWLTNKNGNTTSRGVGGQAIEIVEYLKI